MKQTGVLPSIKVLYRGEWTLMRRDGKREVRYSDGSLQIDMDQYVWAWAGIPSNETKSKVSQGK